MSEEQTANAEQKPSFSIHNVYLKDASLEVPHSPHIFSDDWKPRLDFDLEIGSNVLADGIHEVVLHVTVTVKLRPEGQEEKVAFLIDVQQAGIFSMHGFDNEQTERLLSTTCPGILFPYARDMVSNYVTRAGFPQLVLPPMNFDAMYLQKLREDGKKTQEKAEA